MKKFVSKMLAGALGLSMLCGVAAAEGETYVSWYTFGDVYLSSVRTALDAAMEAKGLTVVDKDSNANQQTQTDDINTALVTGANAVVVNLVESGAIGTAETLMNAIKEKDVPAVFFNVRFPPTTPKLRRCSRAMTRAPSSAPTSPRRASCRAR